jgi:uncharacterized cupredoxin-like copper-binding protein
VRRTPHWIAAIAVVGAWLLAGCSAQQPVTGAGAKAVRITERDFHISAPKHLPSGHVVLSVHNRGPDDHELLVVRAGDHEPPLRTDGMTVDEDGLGSAAVGALEPDEPGNVRELRVDLKPGRYELICNMAGHYFGGMESEVTVR